jgi:tRNA (cytidine/uridine-2'-O-)-methyltransferase
MVQIGATPIVGFVPMRIALYQPDIPQNTGTILRLAACLGVAVDIVMPTGFDLSTRALKRAALDYIEAVDINRWGSFGEFRKSTNTTDARIILMTTKAAQIYTDAEYLPSDILLAGRESAGVPEEVHAAADLRVRVPMHENLRSLNVAVAMAMVLGEAMRQTGGFARLV